jgi:hypothetical protein
MKTNLDLLIEYIEKDPPLSEDETRILYKAHMLNHHQKMEDRMYPYKLYTPSGEYYACSFRGLLWTKFKIWFYNLIGINP